MFGSQGRGGGAGGFGSFGTHAAAGSSSNPFAQPQDDSTGNFFWRTAHGTSDFSSSFGSSAAAFSNGAHAAKASNPFSAGAVSRGAAGVTTTFGFGGRVNGAPQPPLPPPDSNGDGFSMGFGGGAKPPGVATAFGQPAVRPKKTRPPRDPTSTAPTAAFGRDKAAIGAPPGLSAGGNQPHAFSKPQTLASGPATVFGSQQPVFGSQQPVFGGAQATAFGNPIAGARVQRRKKGAGMDDGFASDEPSRAEASSVLPQSGLRPKKTRLQSPHDSLAAASSTVFGREKKMGAGAPLPSLSPSLSPSFGNQPTEFAGQATAARERRKKASPAEDPSSSSSSSPNDEPTKAELASASNLEGTCVDMCSPAERELHIRVDELSGFEKCFPDEPGRERELIIKRFQRSSADHKLDIPSEVRPPGVLRRTQLYIEQEIMDRERGGVDPRLNPPRVPDVIELYNFCWDRFRMIRKDFVLQNYRGAGGRVHPIVLDVHERVARYHILSEHELVEVPSFVAQQNMEQLGQTLKSLNELYDESRNVGDPGFLSPFEPEFRAYFILCALDNGRGLDVLKFVKGLHRSVVDSPQVKFAMQVFVARHTSDYFQFFALLRQATYLQSCLLFRYLPSVRSGALQRMNRAFRNQPYPLVDLMELLCFDDVDQAGAICQHHGLAISQQDEDDDDSTMVQFGGDFETDIQLRKNKRPLPVQGSYVFVGQKQGEYLRRDVCRGVTEYYPDDYPPLSHLIQTLEATERAALYPTRAAYEDEYSTFANYAAYNPLAPPQATSAAARSPQPAVAVAATGGFQTPPLQPPRPPPPADRPERTLLELDSIARRKAELERSHQMALQRIAELQRAKEAKAFVGTERAPVGSPPSRGAAPTVAAASLGDASASAEDVVRQRAEKDAALQRMQRELESRLREQEKQRQLKQQRELEELETQRREEAAAAAAAEAKRAADEAERARRRAEAEAVQRREAEQRAEDARQKAVEALERQRQQQLADEQARQRREAALEAKRQEELARALAERKRALRATKQQQAITRLRFHMWRKYVRASKALPPPVQIDASRFVGPPASHVKPKSAIRWLFKDASAASHVGTRLRHPSEVMNVQRRDTVEAAARTHAPETAWRALDVLSLVGPALHTRATDASAPASWKLVLSDLVDNQRSSFGVWCAAKLGVASADAPVHVFQSPPSDVAPTLALAVCCRYVSAASMDASSDHQLQTCLGGASALLLSLSLSEILETGKRQRWLRRVENLCAHLPARSRVVVSVLLFANVSPSLQSKHAVEAVEACVRKLHSTTDQLVDVEFALVSGGSDDDIDKDTAGGHSAAMISELARVLQSLARRWVSLSGSVVVKLEELLESSLAAAMKRCAPTSSPSSVQAAVQTSIRRLREDLALEHEQATRVDGAIPELAGVVDAATTREAQDRWEAVLCVLEALATERVGDLEAVSPTRILDREDVCSHFFARIAGFIDRLFATRPSPASSLSTRELKQLVHALLVPEHERLVRDRALNPPELRVLDEQTAAVQLPWHRIFVEVYSAFFETLKDLRVAVSADWRSQHTRELLTAAAVAFKSLKRSFGVALVPPSGSNAAPVPTADREFVKPQQQQHLKAPRHVIPRSRREDPRVATLREEIARERAASASFQQLLRREMARCHGDDKQLL
ncbi:hypothetical protein PybrP1_001309 [[Pythium] brassicae (nom. inval.)]|nr:hypothetical protein PybrP1_001309 [[Pythium] brassicae (nom. inval.)]